MVNKLTRGRIDIAGFGGVGLMDRAYVDSRTQSVTMQISLIDTHALGTLKRAIESHEKFGSFEKFQPDQLIQSITFHVITGSSRDSYNAAGVIIEEIFHEIETDSRLTGAAIEVPDRRRQRARMRH
jgi:hypothetical protein